MQALETTSVVLAVVWAVAALVLARTGAPSIARLALLIALAQGAALWGPLAPLVLAAWFTYAVALADGRIPGARRWAVLIVAGAAVGWSAYLTATSTTPDPGAFYAIAVPVALVAAGLTAERYRWASIAERRVVQWIGAGAVLLVGYVVVCVSLHLMARTPHHVTAWLVPGLLAIPLAHIGAALVDDLRAAERALAESIAVAGVATLVSLVYVVIVMGIAGPPKGHERAVLLASLTAAIFVAALAVPVRQRLMSYARAVIGAREPSTEEAVATFAARMSRAVPMDELMLQLGESLHASVPGGVAEIWTGVEGNLTRTVRVPSGPPAKLTLEDKERVAIGQARIGGQQWTSVWLPDLLAEGPDGEIRTAPVSHLGELLGLIVVRRAPGAQSFTDEDERSLVEVARQLGLALHNVRLDSALQASLEELAQRNQELQASRLRIVNASDTSRRAIERNLHDGAQQHLVALAVKLGIAKSIAEEGDSETLFGMLDGLRGDVQETITELRELAHGIYPPLLRDRGLGEALRTAAARSTLPCVVDVDLPGRYPEAVEAAAYFCCLEGMQNAGKYAGASATVRVRIDASPEQLCIELSDDGAGFDASAFEAGHGFVNMQDRLGALGGSVSVSSAIGQGTMLHMTIPAEPLAP